MDFFKTTREKLDFILTDKAWLKYLNSNTSSINIINKELMNEEMKVLIDIIKTRDDALFNDYIDYFNSANNYRVFPFGDIKGVKSINSYIDLEYNYLLFFLRQYIDKLRAKGKKIIFYVSDYEENIYFIEELKPDIIVIDNLNYAELNVSHNLPIFFYNEGKYIFYTKFLDIEIDDFLEKLDSNDEVEIDFEVSRIVDALSILKHNEINESTSQEREDLLNKLQSYKTILVKEDNSMVDFFNKQILVLNENVDDIGFIKDNEIENITYDSLTNYEKYNNLNQNVFLMFNKIDYKIIDHFINNNSNITLILTNEIEEIYQNQFNKVCRILTTDKLSLEKVIKYFTEKNKKSSKLVKSFNVINSQGEIIEQIYGVSQRNLLIERSYIQNEKIFLNLKFKDIDEQETILELYVKTDFDEEYHLLDYRKVNNYNSNQIHVEFDLALDYEYKTVDYKVININYILKDGIVKKSISKVNYKDFGYITMVIINLSILIPMAAYMNRRKFLRMFVWLLLINIAVIVSVKLMKLMKLKKYKKNKNTKNETNVISKLSILEPEIIIEEIEVIEEEVIEKEEVIEEINFENKLYLEELIIVDYVKKLTEYLTKKGIKVNNTSIGKLFASFLSSKLLVIKSDSDLEKLFIEISNYIGANFYYSNNTKTMSKDQNFIKLINNARKNKEEINIILFDNISLEDLDETLYEIVEYAKYPKANKTIKLNNKNIELNDNIYIVINNDAHNFDFKIWESGNFITLDYEKSKEIEVFEDEEKLSNFLFINHYDQINEEFYLDESDWKKIDYIESLINEHDKSILTNVIINQIERYSSMYLSIDNERTKLIDLILSSKVLPLVNSYKIEGLLVEVYNVIERNFDIDTLSETNKLYNELSLINGGQNNE